MKKFSLIIPVYKQASTIKKNIEDILDTLSVLNIPFEIIPVVDGEFDTSMKELEKIRDTRVKPVGYKTNHGKGYAVRYGFSHADGDVIGFMDAGGELKSSALPYMLTQFEFEKCDAIIGSKRHPDSKIYYPTYRKMFSWVYQKLVRLLFGLNIRDSQVGMKIYSRKLLEQVLPRMLVKQFAFDIEILAVSYYLGFRNIKEAPVEIDFIFATTTIVWKKMFYVVFNMVKDTLAVFYRLRILHYYDDSSKRKWRFDPELNFRINIG